MIFTEFRFFIFFALVFCVYWSLRSNTWRKTWLLLASFAFYAAWDWRFLSLILLSIVVDYAVGLGLERSENQRVRRVLLTTSLVVNLGMLGAFKYFDFFLDSAIDLLAFFGFEANVSSLSLVLPVGISFFTFQTLSYTIDIYRRQLRARRNLLDVALFVAFFPQLVAGPIVRASKFLPQLERTAKFVKVAVRPHLALFLLGFIKKACVADNVAVAADAYFADVGAFTASTALLAVLLYAIQIYCDFSGYSDMALGCAGLLGFKLGSNFLHPYLATNLRDFWRRWHISLSTWLRDYLYIALGGNRKGRTRTYLNLMVTMILGGLWHGAAWRFLIWGALHGVGLAVVRRWSERGRPNRSALSKRTALSRRTATRKVLGSLAAWAATMAWVGVGWIFFRAQDIPSAWATLVAIASLLAPHSVGGAGSATLSPTWWLLVMGFIAMHLAMSRMPLGRLRQTPPLLFGLVWGALLAFALLFVRAEAQPFVYFQF